MAALPAPDVGVARVDQLVVRAGAAYLGRYRGQTRLHTESDLRVFLRWCTDQDLDPLAAVRADIERYVRWLQDVRRTSRHRLPAAVRRGRLLPRLRHRRDPAASPADYVRRPTGAARVTDPRAGPSAGALPAGLRLRYSCTHGHGVTSAKTVTASAGLRRLDHARPGIRERGH
jgi:hypothetical protein